MRSHTQSEFSSALLPSAIVAVVYIALGYVFRNTTLSQIADVLAWPPVGVALGLVLLLGRRAWPGVVVAALLEPVISGFPFDRMIGPALGVSAEVIGSAWLLQRIGFRPSLERIRDVMYLVVVAVICGAFAGALVNTAYGVLAGHRPAGDFLRHCFVCYRGDALAFLLITPVVTTWGRDLKFTWLRGRWAEALALFAVTSALAYYIGGGLPAAYYPNFPMRLLSLPLLIWAAFRFGPAGVTSVILLIIAVLSRGSWLQGPQESGEMVTNRLALLWAYAIFGSLMGMVLAATARERRAAKAQSEMIAEGNFALTHSLDLSTVLTTLLDQLARLIPYDTGNVLMVEGDSLVLVAGRGYERWSQHPVIGLRVPQLNNPLWNRIQKGSLIVSDTRLESGWMRFPETEYIRSWLAVPLISGGKIIGLYSLDKASPNFFTEEHRRIAESLAAQAAVAIQNARLYEQRMKVEEALRQSEQKFAKAFYSHPNPMVLSTLDGGQLIECNESYLEFFGYSRHEISSKSAKDFYVNPSDRDALAERIRKDQRFRDAEVRLRTRSGDIRTVLASAELIDLNGQRCILGVIRDITDRRRAEAQLWASEERFVKAFRSSPIPMVITTLDEGRYVDVNEAFLRAMNASREAIIGKTAEELSFVPDPPQRERMLAMLRESGRVTNFPYSLRAHGGQIRQGLISAEVVEIGGHPHVLYAGLDLTEQHRMEERFQTAFRNSPIPMAIISLPDGRYVEVNESAVRLVGRPREEIVGRTGPELGVVVAPDVRDDLISRVLHEGRVQNAEYRFRARPDDVRELLLSGELIEWGDHPHVMVAALDVTERRRLQDQFQKAFQGNPLAMAISTLDDGRYVDVNEGYLRLTGYSREEVIGKSAVQMGVWAEPARRDDLLALLREGQRVENFQIDLRVKSGEIRNGLLYADVVDLGGKSHLLSAVLDVTEHRRLEEQFRQSQKMEAIGRLAGGIAHDFNNLLMVMMGRADLLMMKMKEGDPAIHQLEEIQKAAWRASALTRQLLAFSRKQPVQPRVLDINSIVAEMQKMLRRLIGEDIELVVNAAPELGAIKADPGGMEQILMNLCVNARDAMPSGGKLTLTTANVDFDAEFPLRHGTIAPGHYVLLSVSDTGTGMDASVQARIFEPFFTTKAEGKGTGLGLSTVYGIVQQCDGVVSVYSEPGRGATFKIYFPRIEAQAESGKHSDDALPIARGEETILLVEDEDAVRNIASECLSVAGYTVLTARSGSEALELMHRRSAPLDLLITDVILPGMTGRELVTLATKLEPRLRVLYLSGYTSDAVEASGIEVGANVLVEKPFRLMELASKVRAVLDGVPISA